MMAPRIARRRGSSNQAGFALVELLIVVLFLAILARVAIPGYQSLLLQERAAQALGDIKAVRLAAFSYNVQTEKWPADARKGVLPPELRPYLPEGFSFQREGYFLDWENWTLPDGKPKHEGTAVLLGVSVATEDAALGQALVNLVGEAIARFTISDHYTFILAER